MNARDVLTVFRFEWLRSWTTSRMVWWLFLALFPPAMFGLINAGGGARGPTGRDGFTLFILVPQLVCLMGLLLWATPAIHAELEGRTWPYLAVRPAGKTAVLLGKYFNAVAWTALAAWAALTLSVGLVHPGNLLQWLAVYAVVVALACLAYGALYMFLGVLFLRRAMAIAVFVTLISEVALANVPAMVNELTVQYHLRSLVAQWMGWGGSPWQTRTTGTSPAGHHLFMIAVYTLTLLFAAILVLRSRELVRPQEV